MGNLGRWRPDVGAADRKRKRRLGLTAAALIPIVAVCLLVVVMPSLAVVRSSVAARSAPDLGLTKATAQKVRAGRTYTVTLANKSSQRWLVVKDPYDPTLPCTGRCPYRAGGTASALVGATVQSRGGACVAVAILQGPTYDVQHDRFAQRQLARGLVASGTTFSAAAAPSWFGRVYLGLRPDSSFRCSHARYAVRLTVQRALATGNVAFADSASAAQYSSSTTALERKQSICFHKAQALNRYTAALARQIGAAERRHGLRRRIAQLRAAINAAYRRYSATPCPPR